MFSEISNDTKPMRISDLSPPPLDSTAVSPERDKKKKKKKKDPVRSESAENVQVGGNFD